MGRVVDVEDPDKKGRVKIRVFGLFDELSVESIPWAYPALTVSGGSDTGSGFFSPPKKDSIVNVRFNNGDKYFPEYTSTHALSQDMLDDISGSYENAHSFLYDTVADPGPVKMLYAQDRGLLSEIDGSKIRIRDDLTVSLQEKDGKVIHLKNDTISLGSEDESDEPAVLGDKNADALTELHDRLQDLLKALSQYATQQSSTVSAAYPLSPLAAALSKLLSDVSSINAQLPKLKNRTIPRTRSSKITLDGPPKNQ